jgi:hypothetical protein
MGKQLLKYKKILYNFIEAWDRLHTNTIHKEMISQLLSTGSKFWFILSGGVALNLCSPMSCMSLFEFAMTQL